MTSVTPVQARPSRIAHTSLREYGLRFLFGGLVTAGVGLVGTAFGPAVAGLFLAFPAILIASLTLISRHDGESAAGADALGAAAGSVGLFAFGLVIWALASRLPGVEAVGIACLAWLIVSLATWAGADAWRRGRDHEQQG